MRWEKTEYIKRDTLVYNTSYKDTIIYIPKQIATIDGLTVKVDTAGKAQLAPVQVKSGKAKVKVSIKDNVLKAEGGCDEDSLKAVIRQQESHIRTLESKKEEKIIPQPYIPKIYQVALWIAIASILYVVYKLSKIISL